MWCSVVSLDFLYLFEKLTICTSHLLNPKLGVSHHRKCVCTLNFISPLPVKDPL